MKDSSNTNLSAQTVNLVFWPLILNMPKQVECHHFRMAFRVAVLSCIVLLLIWISTSNLRGRFLSKEGTFVGQEGGFVNKTWFFNQIERIKEELYERISKEMLLEKKSFEKTLLSEEKAAAGDTHSELDKLTETVTGDQIRNADTGENDIDPGGDHGGQNIGTGDIGGQNGDPGDPGFEFSTKEGRGTWRQRQLKRVRRLQNVCSRHQERSSFIESETRR